MKNNLRRLFYLKAITTPKDRSHCSLAFFTIATEMRFIDAEKNGETQELKNDK